MKLSRSCRSRLRAKQHARWVHDRHKFLRRMRDEHDRYWSGRAERYWADLMNLMMKNSVYGKFSEAPSVVLVRAPQSDTSKMIHYDVHSSFPAAMTRNPSIPHYLPELIAAGAWRPEDDLLGHAAHARLREVHERHAPEGYTVGYFDHDSIFYEKKPLLKDSEDE
jgi:hypothetical protein